MIDRNELGTLMDHDLALLEASVTIFKNELPRLLRSLSTAVGEGDFQELERAGHALKGMLLGLAAREAADLAFELERIGRSGEPGQASIILARLQEALAKLGQELDSALSDAHISYTKP